MENDQRSLDECLMSAAHQANMHFEKIDNSNTAIANLYVQINSEIERYRDKAIMIGLRARLSAAGGSVNSKDLANLDISFPDNEDIEDEEQKDGLPRRARGLLSLVIEALGEPDDLFIEFTAYYGSRVSVSSTFDALEHFYRGSNIYPEANYNVVKISSHGTKGNHFDGTDVLRRFVSLVDTRLQSQYEFKVSGTS